MVQKDKLINNYSKIAINSYQIRKEIKDNKSYIVVPVVMMVEGVHSGSRGPTLHTQQELSNNPQTWNGIPIVIGHPQDKDDNYISANSPNVQTVGVVYNTVFDGKLKAEAWLDEMKLIAVSPLASEYIIQQRALEVSVGAFTDEAVVDGEWDKESYHTIASNYKPDHLALLPGEEGACSWSDGCGIRVNEKNKEKKNMDKELKKAIKETDIVVNGLIDNKQGYRELVNSIQMHLDTKDTDSSAFYLDEVYNSNFIYRLSDKDNGESFYKQTYSTNSDNTIDYTDNPISVTKKISYININQKIEILNIKEKNKMAKDVCCEGAVDNLIANEKTRFKVEDKEWLMTLKAEQVAMLEPMVQRTVEPKVEVKEAEIDDKAVIDYLAKKSDEEIIGLVPKALSANIQKGIDEAKTKKAETIKSIMTNAKDVWNETDLAGMAIDTLLNIKATAGVVDYSAQNLGVKTTTEVDEDMLLPADVKIEKK